MVYESMHLAYLGGMEKILQGSVDGKYAAEVKLNQFYVNILTSRLEQIKNYCPSDFARQPVKIIKHGNFKATELRQILNYTGPAPFLGLFPENVYNHFLLLHSAMRVLVSPTQTDELINQAEVSIDVFVHNAHDVYGDEFVSYNIHALLHLTDDVRNFGPLESYSAFAYESNMIYLRKYLKKPGKHLEQIYRREAELGDQHSTSSTFELKLLHQHINGPVLAGFDGYPHYKKLKYGKTWSISVLKKNNTIILNDANSSICVVQNIIFRDEQHIFVVKRFNGKEDFYTSTIIPSSACGVFHCHSLSRENEIVSLNQIKSKCFRMPFWEEMPTAVPAPEHFVVSVILSTDSN